MTSELEKLGALRIRPEVPPEFIDAVCAYVRQGMSLARLTDKHGEALGRRFPEMRGFTAGDLYRLKRVSPTFAMAFYEARADQVERRVDDLYDEIDAMDGSADEARRLGLKLKLVQSEAKAMLPKLFGDGKSPVGPEEMAQTVAKEVRKQLPFAAVPMKEALPETIETNTEYTQRPKPRVVVTDEEPDADDVD